MPDKIIALTTGTNTSLVGMTNEQYALLLWLEDNKALGAAVHFAEWDEDGEEIPTNPDEM